MPLISNDPERYPFSSLNLPLSLLLDETNWFLISKTEWASAKFEVAVFSALFESVLYSSLFLIFIFVPWLVL